MERASYIIYLTILTLSILLFGAMHTYVYTLMSLGVLLAALLLMIKSVRKDHRKGVYQFRIQKMGLHFFFGAILVFLIFQLLPLPTFVVKLLSPEAWVVWEKAWPASAVAAGEDGGGAWHTLAVYGYPVRMSLVRWVVYGFFFFGLVRVLNSRKRIEFLLYWILCLGCFDVLYGLIQAYSGHPHVLWANSVTDRNAATGTYINRNHFAGFMEMGLLLAAAFAAGLSERKPETRSRRKSKPTLKARVSVLLASEQSIQKRALILFAGVVMGVGLVFSASKGGVIAGAGGLLCMSLFLVFRKDQKRKGVVFLVLFLFISAYSLNIGIDYVVSRFQKIESSMEVRKRYSKQVLEGFSDYPAAGVGIGNFKYVFPKYQAPEEKKSFIRYAHNDWAQYLMEAGLMGMVLLLVGMAIYIVSVVRLWRKRNDPFAVCLGIAPMAAIAAIGIHSFFDFNLHIPANFLILLTIMAIGYAALHLERYHRRDVMSYRYYELPLRYRGGVVLVLLLGFIGWTGYTSIRHFMGEVNCHTVPNSTMNRDQHPPVEELLRAVSWDGGNAEYWYKLGSTDYTDYTDEKKQMKEWLDGWLGQNLGKNYKGSLKNPCNLCNLRIKALERSVELNPFDAQYHLRLGWEYAHLWQEKDYHTKWLPAADISMDRAGYFAGVKNPHLHQELGNYWTMRSRSVMPNDPLHHEAWAKAVWHFRKAQSLETGGTLKRMKKEIRDCVWNSYPDEEYIKEVLGF